MLAVERPPVEYGHTNPRIAPPVPARSDIAAYRAEASAQGIVLMPWQEVAARYIEATGPSGGPLYREVCVLVSRRQGKTTLAKPLITKRLRAGDNILHLAQNRELPRLMFGLIADTLSDEPDLFPKRRGRTIWPRYGSGQEEIVLANGGSYRIIAASRGGGRGLDADLVIIDELREMDSNDVIAAIAPTIEMSDHGQIVYLSNAGTPTSVILNAIRGRAGDDPALAYLEWSAAPGRKADDVEGWREANPAIGHYPQVLTNLEATYRRHRLSGTMGDFETEHLCRWVTSMQALLVEEARWLDAKSDLGIARRPMMAVGMDPSGTRASAVIAWRQEDDAIGVRVVADVTGDPIDLDLFGSELRDVARGLGVRTVGFAPWTDADLARYFPNAKPLDGKSWAVASEAFARMVEGGKVRWDGSDEIGSDLGWTVRKSHEGGAWHATKAKDDRPITAALAAVRAVWLASDPKRAGSLRVQ
jgi:hypothetical protein